MSFSHEQKTGKVRIIAGTWRGRKLPICALEGLRPTGDRMRETLFNWLQADIRGVNCLDLFAGSGALGFEALSRGASRTEFVERHTHAARQLSENIQLLQAPAQVHTLDAVDYLNSFKGTPFNLVFVDPPFDANLWQSTFEALISARCLAEDALIYVEAPANAHFTWPPNWEIQKSKSIGAIRAILLRS